MRKIKRIVLHCTSGWNTQSTQSIKDGWFKPVKEGGNGWKTVGYHYLISNDGSYENLLDISKISNGVSGYNSDSIHICYKGGLVSTSKDKNGKTIYKYGDTRTKEQKEAFLTVIKLVLEELKKHQDIDDITIVGHRDLSPDLNGNGKIESREWVKVCPTFDAIEEFGWICGKKALERLKNRKNY